MSQKDFFEDETAVVTSVSRGLGGAIARRLVDCGSDVVVAARSGEALGTVADEVENKTDSSALDVTDDVHNFDTIEPVQATRLNRPTPLRVFADRTARDSRAADNLEHRTLGGRLIRPAGEGDL